MGVGKAEFDSIFDRVKAEGIAYLRAAPVCWVSRL
jgi:hypothetical protein